MNDHELEIVKKFRSRFHASRHDALIAEGVECADRAVVLYFCEGETSDSSDITVNGVAADGVQVSANSAKEKEILLEDVLARPKRAEVSQLLQALTQGWWSERLKFKSEKLPGARPLAGMYAHYLPEVGYDWSVEFDPEKGPVRMFRMDGRGRALEMPLPADDRAFYEQLGTYFDLAAGWRDLVVQHRMEHKLVVAEIEGGYLCGVREGAPGDLNPAAREEPEMAEAFSRYDPEPYDTLEFLSGPTAEELPFEDNYKIWLGKEVEAAKNGEIDLFVLARSSAFVAAVRELAEEREIEVRENEDDVLEFVAGGFSAKCPLEEPYLHTLHCARTFEQGAAENFLTLFEALSECAAAEKLLREKLCEPYHIAVEGGQLSLFKGEECLNEVDLLTLAKSTSFRSTEGRARLYALIGFDPDFGPLK